MLVTKQLQKPLTSIVGGNLLCSTVERNSYRFWATGGRVNDDRIFIFGWTIPLKVLLQLNYCTSLQYMFRIINCGEMMWDIKHCLCPPLALLYACLSPSLIIFPLLVGSGALKQTKQAGFGTSGANGEMV